MYILTCPKCGHQMQVRVARVGAMAKCLSCFEAFELDGRTVRRAEVTPGESTGALEPIPGPGAPPSAPRNAAQSMRPSVRQSTPARPHRVASATPASPDLAALSDAGDHVTGSSETPTIGRDPETVYRRASQRRRAKSTLLILIAVFAPILLIFGGYAVLNFTGVLGGGSNEFLNSSRPPSSQPKTAPVLSITQQRLPAWNTVDQAIDAPLGETHSIPGIHLMRPSVKYDREGTNPTIQIALRSTDDRVYSTVRVRIRLLRDNNRAYTETVVNVPIVGPDQPAVMVIPMNVGPDDPIGNRLIEVIDATPVPGAVMIYPSSVGVLNHGQERPGGPHAIEARLQNTAEFDVMNPVVHLEVLDQNDSPAGIWIGEGDQRFAARTVNAIELHPQLPDGFRPARINVRGYAVRAP